MIKIAKLSVPTSYVTLLVTDYLKRIENKCPHIRDKDSKRQRDVTVTCFFS